LQNNPGDGEFAKNKKSKDPLVENLYFLHVISSKETDYPLYSSDTVSFFLPLARRAANTLRPFALAILVRKPCLFFLFLFEGWNVLFIAVCYYCYFSESFSDGKNTHFFSIYKALVEIWGKLFSFSVIFDYFCAKY